MAEVVAILTTCWRLVVAIDEVVSRIEQTREDARALIVSVLLEVWQRQISMCFFIIQFLEQQARSFLEIVNQGLVGVETSPYLGTIVSLEGLLNDILAITNAYIRMSTVARFRNANQTKRTILDLNKRLRLFVDTYLLQTTTQAARINLEALSGPVPVFDLNQPQIIPDDVQWEVMSRSGSATISVDPRARIATWTRAVGEEHLEDVQSNPVVDTQPARTEMVYPPEQRPVPNSKVYSGRLHKCYHVWRHDVCPTVYRNVVCCPIRVPVCVADYIGRSCLLFWGKATSPNDPGCCTTCIIESFPLCMPEICIARDPRGSLGAHCANYNCAGINMANQRYVNRPGHSPRELVDDCDDCCESIGTCCDHACALLMCPLFMIYHASATR